MENASYGLTLCAESIALGMANSRGHLAEIEAIAVVGFRFHPPADATSPVTPCGRCRQLISEAAQLAHHDIEVFVCSGDLRRIERWTISELLPHAFGPASMSLTLPATPKALRKAKPDS